MKLSEIKGDRLFDLMADITEPLCEIASDKELVSAIKSEQGDEGGAVSKVRAIVPRLMRDHRRSLVQMLAAINGVTPDEYMGSLSLASLLEDMYDMLTDEELPAFLS